MLTNIMAKLRVILPNRRLPYVLALLPILFLGILLIYKTVNVPYWDQWEFVPLIHHVHDCQFYFDDFWQQHNEHRLLLPRIIMVTSALLTHWNIRAESVISFVIAIGSFVILMKALRHTQGKRKHAMLLFVPLLLGVIWFSPVQLENWLWGWQIQWFLSVAGVAMVLLGLARIKDRICANRDIALIIAGALIALLSLGNGFIIWPLAVAALLYSRIPLKRIAVVAATGAVAFGLYYSHYVNMDPSPDAPKLLILKEPILFIKYALAYIGRPLNFMHRPTEILGAVLLVAFVGLVAYLFIKKRAIFRAVLPWVVLGLYVCGSAGITALSRMGLGINQAYASRYTTVSSLLLVAMIVICIESREIFKHFFGKRFQAVAILVTTLVCVCVLSNVAWGVHASNQRSQELKASQQCTHTANPSDACALYAYPNKEVFLKRLHYLKQIHWGGY